MSHDLAFRVVFFVDLLLLIPLMMFHRLKAHTSEKLDRRQEGLFILATLRPLGFVFFAGAGTCLVNPARMAWSSVPLPMWLRWSGASVFALSWALLFWTCAGSGPTSRIPW